MTCLGVGIGGLGVTSVSARLSIAGGCAVKWGSIAGGGLTSDSGNGGRERISD
jgi:hypothetical protein